MSCTYVMHTDPCSNWIDKNNGERCFTRGAMMKDWHDRKEQKGRKFQVHRGKLHHGGISRKRSFPVAISPYIRSKRGAAKLHLHPFLSYS